MNKPRDYYEVLGLSKGAGADDIRKAYRRLARQLHPDMNKEADAAAKFAELQEAYDVLSDEEKRKSYDRFGHAGVGAASNAANNQWGGRGPTGRTVWTNVEGGDFEGGDFSSIFEQMFGGMGTGTARPGSRARPSRTAPVRGRDIEHRISITFLTAALGGTEQLRFGPGAASNELTVRIPAGIESGAKLRVKGKGQPSPLGQGGGESGDLILTVDVGRHPWYYRDGLDLLIDVPVSIVEAVRGTSINVPLLKDGSVEVKIPPGISSGQKLRVRGRGITDSKGKAGDLYVVIQIAAPASQSLSPQAQQALETLESELKHPRKVPPWVDE